MQTSLSPSAAQRLYLPQSMREQMMIHLLEAAPNEGVGLLATGTPYADDDGVLAVDGLRFYPGTNLDASPSRFTMDPSEVMKTLRRIREEGHALGAIVHSHLRGPATPSATDLREAHYPDALMLIASFAVQPAVLSAWRVVPEDELRVVQSVEVVIRRGM